MNAPAIQQHAECYVVLSIGNLESMIRSIKEARGNDAPDYFTGVFRSSLNLDADGQWQISSIQLAP